MQKPWTPLETQDTNGIVTVSAWGRAYRQEKSYFPTGITTQDREILYAPMRLTGEANGEPIVWGEQGCYLLNPTEESACVNGYAQSQCLIVDSCMRYEYDGAARWDIRVLPRGMTVPQVFGIEPCLIKGWNLTKLHLEIPLRKEGMNLYNTWCASWSGDNGVHAPDGTPLMENGALPNTGICMPFMPSIWLGDEKTGFQLVTESDEIWQPEEKKNAMEIRDCGDHWLLVYHLLDSLPRAWENPNVNSPSLSFTFGMVATPVKPFDYDYLKYRAVHIDCFTKIKTDYLPFLTGAMDEDNPEPVIDRLTRAGVNMLILHEKWNTIQNNWNVPVNRAEEIRKLVRLCHERGMKVIPYFGYEITSAMPEYTDVQNEISTLAPNEEHVPSNWYRVPYQRANRVCYRSRWQDVLVEGMMGCIDRFHFDGVYLDGTCTPFPCANARHGCGYTDAEGKRHATFPILAYRNIMKRIGEGVHARGGIVNPHPGGATIPFISSFVDMLWDGEHLQTRIRDEGLKTFSLEYYRSEYLGVNIGIPVQFIVYEFPGVWDFDMSLSLTMIHNTYPRPNAVGHPLDVMEKIWDIIGTFGISEAKFLGYWENGAYIHLSEESCKASFYARKQVDGSARLLTVVSNPTTEACDGCRVEIQPEAFGKTRIVSAYDAMRGAFVEGEIQPALKPFSIAIYEIVLA